MAYSFDPEIGSVLVASAAAMGEFTPPARGDVNGLREMVHGLMTALADARPEVHGVETVHYQVAAPDGHLVDLIWYKKTGAKPGAAVLYLHGGGMMSGNILLYDKTIAAYVARGGVPMLAVEYRLAPEHPHPVPVEDCYAGLDWLFGHAAELGVDTARIAVMGDSAGGGLAAGVALLARDRGIVLARQILIYPMLDDTNTDPDPALAPFVTWSYDANFTGWSALLGESFGTGDVSPIAAPARARNLAGLAPAYVEVGELDIFRDEDIEYARRLSLAAVPVELHVHPGAPHAFEALAPQSGLAQRAGADRIRVLASL